jgi:Tfp pilus assembly protein PilZ
MSQKNPIKKDLRRHPRIDTHIPGDYQILLPEEGNNRVSFATENISIGGLMFYSFARIEIGTDLLISLSVEKNRIEFSAKVVWITEWRNSEDPNKAFAIGLQYFKITSEAISKINQAASRVVLLQPASKTIS